MIPDTFVAEVGDCAETPVPSANAQSWPTDMDTDWNEDRVARDKMYKGQFAGRNHKRIKQGIEAYKRDLAQLLRDRKERHLVAYDGDTQVGMATTREKLLAELEQNGISDRNNLFIKVVSNLEDKRESMLSQNHA